LEHLHALGYRLAHVPDVMWVGQKASLAARTRAFQGVDLKARIAVTRALETRHGPIGRRIARRGIRHALA
jgi:hypothetical protein